jgi:hypothetical protein
MDVEIRNYEQGLMVDPKALDPAKHVSKTL